MIVGYEVSATFKSETPLHIGTGSVNTSASQIDDIPEFSYSPIVLDHAYQPFIPGATLKGALLAMAETRLGSPPSPVLALLRGDTEQCGGVEPETRVVGNMGHVTFCDAYYTGGGVDGKDTADAMPYEKALAKNEKGLRFVSARTAIDRASGTAADHKLFFQEMAVSGCQYAVRLRVPVRGGDQAQARKVAAGALALLRLAGEQGLYLGQGANAGWGHLAIVGEPMVHDLTLDTEALKKCVNKASNLNGESGLIFDKPSAQATTIKLVCEGPVIVADSSNKKGDTRESSNQQNPQMFRDQDGVPKPHIPPSSIIGTLRSMAEDLCEGVPGLTERVEIYDPDKPLHPVDALFGVTGWAKVIQLRKLNVQPLNPNGFRTQTFTSVALDQFTGGPYPGGLFSTKGFVGVKLDFELTLNQTREAKLSEDARHLFAALTARLMDGGMMLGHRTNSGFGWFLNKGEGL